MRVPFSAKRGQRALPRVSLHPRIRWLTLRGHVAKGYVDHFRIPHNLLFVHIVTSVCLFTNCLFVVFFGCLCFFYISKSYEQFLMRF